MGARSHELSRRDFMKLGLRTGEAIGAAYILESCGTRREVKPFVLSPEKEHAGSGIAVADFSGSDPEIYLAVNEYTAGNADAAFESDITYIGGLKHLIAENSYYTSAHWWQLVDHDTVKQMVASPFVIRDVRFSQRSQTLIRAEGPAPVMVDGHPSEGDYVPTVFSIAVGSGDPWLATLAPVPDTGDDTSQHVVDILRGAGSRVQQPDMLFPDEPIFAAAIVPSRYKEEMISTLARPGLSNAVNKSRELSVLQGVSVEQDLYVNTYDATGRVLTGTPLRLPMGLEVGLVALHQLADGRVLALVSPRQHSYLFGNYDSDASLIADAKSVGHLPTDPVWVDVMDIWVEPGIPKGTAPKRTETLQMQESAQGEVQSTPTMSLVDQEIGTLRPTATPTITPTPYITRTPEPTHTPMPTSTEPSSFTGWQPTTTTGYAETETSVPVIPSENPLGELLCWGNVIGWPALLAFLGWKVGGSARRIAIEEKKREQAVREQIRNLTLNTQETPVGGQPTLSAPTPREVRHNTIRELTGQINEKHTQLATLEAHGHDKDKYLEYYESVKRELASLEGKLKALQPEGSQVQQASHGRKLRQGP